MRWVLIIVGILFVLMGAVWALQGGNLLPYGTMAGESRWIYMGLALAGVGVLLLVIGLLRKAARRS